MSTLDFLHGVDVIEIIEGARPIRTLKSSVIGLIGTAGKGPVNEPVLLTGNERVAAATFGAVKEDGFTIPAAIHAIFQQGGATIVAINVVDATAVGMKTSITDELVTAVGYSAQLAHGYISAVTLPTSFIVQKTAVGAASYAAAFPDLPAGDTITLAQTLAGVTVAAASLVAGTTYKFTYTTPALVLDTDYSLDTENGIINIVPTTSHIVPNSQFGAVGAAVDYTYVDSTKPVASDIIGTINGSGVATGIQLLLQAKATTGVQPRLLIAPNYTQTKPDAVTRNAVADALNTIAQRLRAIAIVDTPNTTKEAAVQYAQDWGVTARVYAHYPFYRVLRADGSGTYKAVPASPFIAGVIAREDNDEGFWFSPSNKLVNGIVGIDKPVDFSLSDTNSVSNYLNLNNVVTTIFEEGLRLWGNRVTNGEFISGRRTADMVEESILVAHLWAVDRNITRGYLFEVTEGVNAYIRQLKANGAIVGGKAWADPTLNTQETLADGHVYIDFEFTRPVPAEHLTFRTHLVNDYFADIFDSNPVAV